MLKWINLAYLIHYLNIPTQFDPLKIDLRKKKVTLSCLVYHGLWVKWFDSWIHLKLKKHISFKKKLNLKKIDLNKLEKY